MNLALGEDNEAFRRQVRAFVAAKLPADIRGKVESGAALAKADHVAWQKILHRRGWIAPGWPTEHGGAGWSALRCYLLEEELARGGAPRIIPFGLSMVGPVLMAFGSAAQKAAYLPRILASDDWWCQGYSEPGAGSDLAALGTRAVANGDHYVVNGAKTWTTFAQYADMMFCLVRTASGGRKQEGISFLLIDMTSPGVSVHPIVTFDGGQEINQVFFDDVRVPRSNLVGEEGRGWTYAKFLLGHERSNIAGLGRSKRQLARLEEIAALTCAGGRPLASDPGFGARIAEIGIELRALEILVLRVLSAETAGRAPGPEASLLKLRGTEIQQAISELLCEAVGLDAQPLLSAATLDGQNEPPVGPAHALPLAPAYFNWRKTSIYGGSNEIQKNIVAKLVLGL